SRSTPYEFFTGDAIIGNRLTHQKFGRVVRRPSGTLTLLAATSVCTSTAQRTAFTTLRNSSSSPSPVVLTMRPLWFVTAGSTYFLAKSLQRRQRAALVPLHQPRVPRDVG